MPGTVVALKRADGCSLEKAVKSGGFTITEKSYEPPACSIGLVLDANGGFSYKKDSAICKVTLDIYLDPRFVYSGFMINLP